MRVVASEALDNLYISRVTKFAQMCRKVALAKIGGVEQKGKISAFASREHGHDRQPGRSVDQTIEVGDLLELIRHGLPACL